LANIINDRQTLEEAKNEAYAICEKDPNLSAPENAPTRAFLQSQKTKIGWGKIA
jgi:hypothetical protein